MVVETDILIVGGGMAGAATAYHLARQTAHRILIVEQEPVPGVHSSGRNAAIIRERADDPILQPLLTESADQLRTGEWASFHRCGLALVGDGNQDVGRFFPRAAGRGRWYPDDGVIDVASLLQTYLKGLAIRYNTRVLQWTRQHDDIHVETSNGEIRCRWLINAAGPWAGDLGRLPLTPMNRHLFVTAPLGWVDSCWPCVWDGNVGLYFRPESGGLLLSCCDESPAAPGDYEELPAVYDILAEKISAAQPGLGDLAIRSSWVGQRTFAPDRRFVIGFDPRDNHVFHVAGLGGHGVTASFAVGRSAADLFLGKPSGHMNPFQPARLY